MREHKDFKNWIVGSTVIVLFAVFFASWFVIETLNEPVCSEQISLIDVGRIEGFHDNDAANILNWVCTSNVEVRDYRGHSDSLYFKVESCDLGFAVCGQCALVREVCR